MKKFCVFFILFVFSLNLSALSYGADEVKKTLPKAAARANIGLLSGTVSSINSSNPENVTIEIKSSADQTTHTVSVTPWTNITKVTDISELKSGDAVRIISRRADNKEVAMAVTFGKIQNRPAAKSQSENQKPKK